MFNLDFLHMRYLHLSMYSPQVSICRSSCLLNYVDMQVFLFVELCRFLLVLLKILT
jgi:hypothetical protein